jgi:hypothetical protein
VTRIKSRFGIEHLWGLIIIAGIFVFINTHPIRPYDFWWHITVGKEILSTRAIPTTDIYSFTEAGQPYPSYQMFWLMEVVLYSVYRLGGPALIVFFQSILVTSAYVILFWICKHSSNSWRIAAIGTIFAAALGLNDWNVRPQGVTFLLASLILLAIYEYRRKSHWGWLVLIPSSMLIWVNSHGTFIIGLTLVGIWWGQEIWTMVMRLARHEKIPDKRSVIIPGILFIITTLVCLINPRGIGIITYLRTLTGNQVIQNLVTEWAAPTFHSLIGTLFLVGLILSGILLIISPKRPNFFQVITYLIFGILGLRTLRGSVWFGLVMAPILAEHIAAFSKRLRKPGPFRDDQSGSTIINLLIAGMVILMAIITLPCFKGYLPLPAAKAGLIASETPIQATNVLLEIKPEAKLFNSMSFGSYLIWAAYPQYQVFVDSRIELFPTEIWLDYLKISNASDGWESLLDDYGINTLMLSPIDQSELLNAVDMSNGWIMVYQDDEAVIFSRASGSQ